MPTAATKQHSAATSPYPGRLSRLRRVIATSGQSHALITNPLDVAYLTGFHGGDSYLLLGAKDAAIISDFRYAEELEPIRRRAKIIIREGAMKDAVVTALKNRGIRACAVQAEAMTIAERDSLARAAGRSVRLLPVSGLVAAMRAVKDAGEIELIRRAVRLQEQALLATLPHLKPGMTELEVAARLEFEMKVRGSSQPGFQTIVAAQPFGSLPHYRPGKAKLAMNKTVLIDWGSVYHGYHGDMTRVFALGKWPAKIKEIYQITLDAKEHAAAALAPGRTTKEIDAIARDYITKHGYGKEFGHGLGHGLGFNGHEDPRITHMAPPAELQPGHVVTIEPGIYLPGVGGVRIEDDYVITGKGAKNLCTLPQSLEWATL
ncbi:MAG: aminopeptidase P family protein [Phycisphaerae bacterium]|nr:aminopeptidase P family protein [Phycisphaerae bacterium]